MSGEPYSELMTLETVDLAALVMYLEHVGSLVHRYHGLLTRLDAVLGDGDHGDNVVAGFDAVASFLRHETVESVGELLSSVGRVLASSLGGASGSLYGSAFMAAGLAAGDIPNVTGTDLGRLLDAGASAIARRGHCDVGDKTMYDTLRPAADTFLLSVRRGDTAVEATLAAVAAGRAGMASTRRLVARRGLALRLGQRSIGHVDPGAVSAFLLLVALVPPGTRTGLRSLRPTNDSARGEPPDRGRRSVRP